MQQSKILIVEDNDDMQQVMKDGLEKDGYAVTGVRNGNELLAQLGKSLPDIILLDIGLPDESGLSLIQKIRLHTNVPVIIVSGRNDSVDKIVGLEMGADDYVGKPFQIKELSARIKAHLRRASDSQAKKKPQPNIQQADRLGFDRWVLDRQRLQVFNHDGISAGLTLKEFKLLEVFIASPNRVLSREQLLDLSRDNDFNVTDRAIDTQIVRLRKKLGGDIEHLIQSVRGAGYLFTASVTVI